MIKLNDDNIYVGQIKQILHRFNLPKCRVKTERVTPVEGEIFIDGDGLYVRKDGTDKRLRDYKFGDYIENVTDNMRIDSLIYDEHTHRYLGEYLRFIRDYTGVDMMGMYNCFSYNKANITQYESDVFPISSNDSRYDVFSVPVRFGEKYTLALDWHGELSYAFGYHSFGDDVTLIEDSISRVSGLRFDSPITIESPSEGDTFKKSMLTLFIKIPKACESEIVVLEGEYDSLQLILDGFSERLGDELIEYIPEGEDEVVGNYDYVTKHQLLDVNTRGRHLIADRLIEYLSNQVITPNDPVIKNIKRLQQTLYDKKMIDSIKSYGLWGEDMRKTIYRYLWKTGGIDSEFDLLSYCDKDVEKMLGYLKNLSMGE